VPTSTADGYFNPLNPDHISDPDDLMQRSRIRCPVGKVSDVLSSVNTDLGVRQAFDDTKHLSSMGNFSVGAEDVQWGPYAPITNTAPRRIRHYARGFSKDFAPVRMRKSKPRVVHGQTK
jgi:hypothetical protein